MNEQYKWQIPTCCIPFLFLFIVGLSSAPYASSISSQMYAIHISDSLQQLYDRSNEYTQRYILKYLPAWLDHQGVYGLPLWADHAITKALESGNAMLIREAVILAGKYQLQHYRDRLTTLYKDAHKNYQADADRIRTAVVEALAQIGENTTNAALLSLLQHTPRFYLDPEFSALLRAVSMYGDSSCIGDLTAIENILDVIISGINPQDDPHRYYERYSNVHHQVQNLKNNIQSKSRGGSDE